MVTYPGGVLSGSPSDLEVGADARLWFTEPSRGVIGRVAADGRVTEFTGSGLLGTTSVGLVLGSDGALWFAERAQDRLGRLTTGPGARTASPTGVTEAAVTLGGAVHPAAQATPDFFEYGATTAYGQTTPAGSVPAGASVPVGSQFDASEGSVTLVTALPGGRTQTGTVRGGRFEVRQDARAGGAWSTSTCAGRGPGRARRAC